MREYWIDALARIASRRRKITKQFAEDDERLWKELAWLVELEDFVRYCMENPEVIYDIN